MRVLITAALVCSVMALGSPLPEAREPQPQNAARVLAEARAALGGEAPDSIRSLTATGSSVLRVLESTIGWSTVEISVELPDKFLRATRWSGYEPGEGASHGTNYQGFNGDALLDSAALRASWHLNLPPPAGSTAPLWRPPEVESSAQQRLQRQKQVFLRLMLPLFAAAPPGIALQFETGGQGEVDGRLANIIVVKTIDDTRFRLYLDAVTHLPMKIAWTAARIGREEMESGSPAMARPAADSRAVEWAVTFSDYKTEAGVTWPRRLTTFVGDRQFEDVRLRGYRINPRISARTFDPRW